MKIHSHALFAPLAPIVCIAVAMLAGCASSFNPIGESKYDCNRKQDPSSFYCRSFSAVEASTNGPLPETRFGTPFRIEDQDARQNIAPTPDGQNPAQAAPNQVAPGSAAPRAVALPVTPYAAMVLPHQLRMRPLEGAPVRNGPVVQRVWIKRHVTADDALVESTFVYKETQAPSWAGFRPSVKGAPTDTTAASYPRRALADKSDRPSTPASGLAAPAESPRIFQPTSASARSDEEAATPPADTGDNSMPK